MKTKTAVEQKAEQLVRRHLTVLAEESMDSDKILAINAVACARVTAVMEDKTVYFQPPGIRPQFCEAGMISETDPEYIWYYDEPCKILISEVKIIPKEDVIYDKKKRYYLVKSAL